MTDLEERVRDALLARAEEFTTSPDAWQRTTTRAGRRGTGLRTHGPARRRWLTRFTPLAAAASVLVIGLGTAVLAGTGGLDSALRDVGLGPSAGGAPQGPPSSFGGRPSRVSPCGLARLRAPRGVPAGAVSFAGVAAWFSTVKGLPHIVNGTWLCTAYSNGGRGSTVGMLGRGPLALDIMGNGPAFRQIHVGAAVKAITSVEAVLANGHDVRGVVKLGRGYPYAVWWVSYPANDSATLVFRDAAGHVVTRLRESVQPPARRINPLKHPVLLTPADVYCTGGSSRPASQEVRVRQLMGTIEVWTYVQFTDQASGHSQPSLCEAAGVVGDGTTYSSSYSLPAGQLVAAVNVLGQTSTVSGIAVPGVASVTAVLPGGRTYIGKLVNGPGFPYLVWLVSYPTKDPATLIFRDRAGRQVAVLHAAANVWPVTVKS